MNVVDANVIYIRYDLINTFDPLCIYELIQGYLNTKNLQHDTTFC